MKHIIRLFAFVAAAFVFQGCATVSRNNAFKTSHTTNQVKMSDLELVGETEVSVSYRTLFGIFRHIDKVNGEEFDSTDKSYTVIGQQMLGAGYAGPLKKAYGKLLTRYPDARYFQVVRVSKKTDRLFLGTESEAKAIVRAYNIRKKPYVEQSTHECECDAQTGASPQKTESKPEKVVEEKPCYTLEEISELIDKKINVRGKTICAVGAINFDTGKSTIKRESYDYLNKVAEVLKRTNSNIDVKGHTDNVGSDELNMKLSEARAKSVMEYLIKRGVKRKQISYSFYGKTRPLTTNDTEEGRLTNRRVEFEILNTDK